MLVSAKCYKLNMQDRVCATRPMLDGNTLGRAAGYGKNDRCFNRLHTLTKKLCIGASGKKRPIDDHLIENEERQEGLHWRVTEAYGFMTPMRSALRYTRGGPCTFVLDSRVGDNAV